MLSTLVVMKKHLLTTARLVRPLSQHRKHPANLHSTYRVNSMGPGSREKWDTGFRAGSGVGESLRFSTSVEWTPEFFSVESFSTAHTCHRWHSGGRTHSRAHGEVQASSQCRMQLRSRLSTRAAKLPLHFLPKTSNTYIPMQLLLPKNKSGTIQG